MSTRTLHPKTPLLVAAALLAGAVATPGGARAQNEINYPPPNVLLLVDTSGSMEYKSNRVGCPDPSEPCYPKCFPGEANAADHERSRWIELVEVLTGSMQGYACYAHDRSRPDFTTEFSLGSSPPYDRSYVKPYHRPISNGCVPGPGVLPPSASPYEFPTGAIGFNPFSTGSYAINYGGTCSTFQQSADGLLDAYNGQIRFGLMTFDSHQDQGTGLDGSGGADYASGINGRWSYYLNGACPPGSSTSYCSGNPDECLAEYPWEVGARNAAAPPWEGRMVAFGPPGATAADLDTRNQWIQKVLLGTRPHGGTPIAGLLHDARDFLVNDNSLDPLNPSEPFGPNGDPQIGPECRQNTIVLLSDGEPNLELRPHCEPGIGLCPYDKPEDIARDLSNNHSTRTYVVGFAVDEVDPDGDGNFTPCEDLASTSYCGDPAYLDDDDLQACCTLNRIAFEGTPTSAQSNPEELTHALFAQDATGLRDAIAQILSLTFDNVTARTSPAFSASAAQNASDASAFQFTSGANVVPFSMWEGVLERTRFRCNADGEPEQVPRTPSEGDDFIANVDSGSGPERLFYTVIGDGGGAPIQSNRSMRPYLSGSDGIGNYSGTQTAAQGLTAAGFATAIPPDAIAVTDTTCDSGSEDLNATQCRDRYLRWLVGLDNGTQEHRCPVPGQTDCNLISDIFHSSPVVRTKPTEGLREDAYTKFATDLQERNTFLYTSSNDGFLHAFYVAPGVNGGREVKSRENNEQWAFVPPAVLPHLPGQYPRSRRPLLDSTAVIKDVIATNTGAGGSYPFRLERSRQTADNGEGEYRTILVQSFGPLQGGYFAIDITKPEYDGNDQDSGPRFLWQLTTAADGTPLFGKSGSTPLITTAFMDINGDDVLREIAVAVLPGGNGGSPTGNACATDGSLLMPAYTAGFDPRTNVRCYDYADNDEEAASLTVVRLDTGQIIRTFRADTGNGVLQTLLSPLLTTVSGLPPLVGQPVAYPAATGQIADRVFIGDRDGRVWRLDLSDTDPSDWTFQVFFDTYTQHSDINDAQPIVTAPVLSVDDSGNITLNVATGDQEILTNSGVDNYVYSLTEVIDENTQEYSAQVNWFERLTAGERVVGRMTLFDSRLFFATFTPNGAGGTCGDNGESTVWGVNYILPEDTADLSSGGAPEFPTADPAIKTKTDGPYEGVAFGVGIRQQPSCSEVETSQVDDFLGYGSFSTASQVTPGKFELVIQARSDGSGGGAPPPPGLAQVQAIDLPMAARPVRIDSWAAIFE